MRSPCFFEIDFFPLRGSVASSQFCPLYSATFRQSIGGDSEITQTDYFPVYKDRKGLLYVFKKTKIAETRFAFFYRAEKLTPDRESSPRKIVPLHLFQAAPDQRDIDECCRHSIECSHSLLLLWRPTTNACLCCCVQIGCLLHGDPSECLLQRN